MQHIEEVEREEQMQESDTTNTSATAVGGQVDKAASTQLAGSAKVNGDRENAPTNTNSTTKLADIEKRKSFADMKLAEVATGGPQQWTFENLPEEPSTPCDEETNLVSSASAVAIGAVSE